MQVQATTTGPGEGEVCKTREWECRITILGPRAAAYTAAEIAAAQSNYLMNNPTTFQGDPTGPPTGGRYVNGPTETDWWTEGPYQLQRSRDPANPTAADEVINGEHYITFRYKYIEDKFAYGE